MNYSFNNITVLSKFKNTNYSNKHHKICTIFCILKLPNTLSAIINTYE